VQLLYGRTYRICHFNNYKQHANKKAININRSNNNDKRARRDANTASWL